MCRLRLRCAAPHTAWPARTARERIRDVSGSQARVEARLRAGPLPVPGWGSCLPRSGLYFVGSFAMGSGGGEAPRDGGSSVAAVPGLWPPSSWWPISRASTSARSDGTALPSILCTSVRPQSNRSPSGNVCRQQSSRVFSLRFFQWKGPVAVPGCAWIVQEGRDFASFSRKLQ